MNSASMPAFHNKLATLIRSGRKPVHSGPPPNAITNTWVAVGRISSKILLALIMLNKRSTPKEIPTQGISLPNWLKKRASKRVRDLVLADLENTDWLAIAPVSNALNAIVIYLEFGRESPQFEKFLFRWPDFLYMTKEGMLMCGTNGVQVWDVAFALQYCILAGVAERPELQEMIINGYRFL
ncbi:hypothetical protein FF38_03872, partial [Lucilia cuprina]